ncbi:cubilin [Octopus vulgaris]|uniref:Cubilin n=1 Tax=Octopus vulgaris TaxID=6645 RepID=A0AA36AQU4_OCTVU|nr:cubilin [Octopus vulgaris]
MVSEGTEVRKKRDISNQLPRIVTSDGHLIFMTGVNHNITFKSSSGGFVNIDGHDLKDLISSQKKLNVNLKSELEQMKASQQTLNSLLYTNITRKLTSMEQNYNRLKSRLQNLNLTVSNLLSQSSQTPPSASQLRTLKTTVDQLQSSVQEVKTDLEEDNCASNPCLHGGTCYDRYKGFYCNCIPGWMGPSCSEDVNECSEFVGTQLGCQNGGTCINTYGSYRCQCSADWHGIHCSTRHDDCTGSSSSELCGHGTCVNVKRQQPNQPKYSCICEPGWTHPSNSPSCTVDIDECNLVSSPCFKHAQVHCINLPGSFRCSPCPTGYTGDGVTCNYVGFCGSNNGGCHPSATCSENTYDCGGSYTGVNGSFSYPTVEVCGETIRGKTHGVIRSPGYPHNYPHNRDCVWTIEVEPNKDIYIHFGEVSLEDGVFCYDYLEIRNGLTADAALLRKICHSGSPKPLRSTEPYLYIRFHTDSSYSAKGFHISFSSMEDLQGCGGMRSQKEGVITSTNFPNSYGSNEDCVWIIQPQHTVIFSFDVLDLPGESPCLSDYVEVRDGSLPVSPLIGRYCGQTKPSEIFSNQNSIWVHFKSNVSDTHMGFRARWKVACGGTYREPSGVLQTPFYGASGDNDTNEICIYVIWQQPSKLISLIFEIYSYYDQSINGTNCTSNYIEIRQGTSKTSPLLGKYCNYVNLPPAITAQGQMRIEFKGGSGSLGFRANYTTNDAGCGGVLTGPLGTVASPLKGDSYPNGIQCTWNIIVDPQLLITLVFTQFALESHSTCHHDYVKIIDGKKPSNELK